MIWLDVAHHTTLGLSYLSSWSDVHALISYLPGPSDIDWSILAQYNTDPFQGVRQTISNFFSSGRVWVFLAGLVFGYIIRGMTTYG